MIKRATPIRVLGVREKKNVLAIKLGADDPLTLEDKTAEKAAKHLAKRKGFKKVRGAGRVRVHGQNELVTRTFYYHK